MPSHFDNLSATKNALHGELTAAQTPDHFYLMRDEHDIAPWLVAVNSPAHVRFMQLLRDYPVGRTNRYLFQRVGQEAAFAVAARYVINELQEAVIRGHQTFGCPLPDGGEYKPNRFVHVSPEMVACIFRAMERHGDLGKAPGPRAGLAVRTANDWSWTVKEWQMSEKLLSLACQSVCEQACANQYIVMRPSWHTLAEVELEKFRTAWLQRELRLGRDGDTYAGIFTGERDRHTGKKIRRKIGSRRIVNRDGEFHVPSSSEWDARWDAAKTWYPMAAGRQMTTDEPGVAVMLESLSRSNAFTARHEWRDDRGHVEFAPRRMSHRVFRDRKLDEHGRFYYSAQSMSKEHLAGYTVDGEETDTGDIVCTHPTMILGMDGNKSIRDAPFDGDVYGHHARQELETPELLRASLLAAIGDREVDEATIARLMTYDVIRHQYKRAYSVGLNAPSLSAAVNALARNTSDDPSAGHLCPPAMLAQEHDIMEKPFWSRQRIQDVVDKLAAEPTFGPSMFKKRGPKLMYLDASWMERVRHRLEADGIAYRDCHDSITCATSKRDTVDAIMKEEWRAMFGHFPEVKWSKRHSAGATTTNTASAETACQPCAATVPETNVPRVRTRTLTRTGAAPIAPTRPLGTVVWRKIKLRR